MTEEIKNNYKGFSLFNDVEDEAAKIKNRATVLANIAEDHSKNQKISPNGMGLIMGYFNELTDFKKQTLEAFVISMKERGFVLTTG